MELLIYFSDVTTGTPVNGNESNRIDIHR